MEEHARLCKPDTVHICDGTERENELLLYMLQKDGILRRLPKYENWYGLFYEFMFNLSSYILVRLLKIIMKIIIKYFLGLLISCCLVFYWVHFEHGIRFVLLFICDCH